MVKKQEKIVGIRALEEAIAQGTSISKVFIQKGQGDARKALMKSLREEGVPYQMVPKEKINSFYSGNHQGVIGLVAPIQFYQLTHLLPSLFEQGKNPAIALLDGITDVRNFGAIARSAECLGVDALVIPNKKSVTITEDAVKTSAGALLHIPVCREDDLNNALEFISQSGLNTLGLSEKANKEPKAVNFNEPTAIILGAEDEGISRELEPMIDDYIKIPMKGTISSLNVSVSAGIVFYEMVRQSK